MLALVFAIGMVSIAIAFRIVAEGRASVPVSRWLHDRDW
jgi:hypothetical protein